MSAAHKCDVCGILYERDLLSREYALKLDGKPLYIRMEPRITTNRGATKPADLCSVCTRYLINELWKATA